MSEQIAFLKMYFRNDLISWHNLKVKKSSYQYVCFFRLRCICTKNWKYLGWTKDDFNFPIQQIIITCSRLAIKITGYHLFSMHTKSSEKLIFCTKLTEVTVNFKCIQHIIKSFYCYFKCFFLPGINSLLFHSQNCDVAMLEIYLKIVCYFIVKIVMLPFSKFILRSQISVPTRGLNCKPVVFKWFTIQTHLWSLKCVTLFKSQAWDYCQLKS